VKEVFDALTETADGDMLRVWERKADEAQKNHSTNVKAMDYFAVKEYPRSYLNIISIT
jgi:hypothetical protein